MVFGLALPKMTHVTHGYFGFGRPENTPWHAEVPCMTKSYMGFQIWVWVFRSLQGLQSHVQIANARYDTVVHGLLVWAATNDVRHTWDFGLGSKNDACHTWGFGLGVQK